MMRASTYLRRMDELFQEILKFYPEATVALDPKTGRTFVYERERPETKIVAIIGAWKASHRPGLVLEARMPNGHELWHPPDSES